MTRINLLAMGLIVFAAAAQPTHNLPERLAKWKRAPMPFHAAGLSAREVALVEKLVDASRLLDAVYWRQSDIAGLELFKSNTDASLRRMLLIMGSRWDLLDGNRPFAGGEPMPPGREMYPRGLTRDAIEQYVKKYPQDRAAIYSGYTVVKRNGDRLTGTPYHEEYAVFVKPMADLLREAAGLSDDPAFAKYLRLRADALFTDDYYQSDLAWVDLKNPKFDLIFAPYETYNDELLGVKTSYGAAVLIRNEEESRKLETYERYVPEIQDALPLDAADRPSLRGKLAPMEVMDAPYRGGDLRYGYQAVADNLPNDRRIHQEKGSKRIFFKNFMDARVNYVILPVAKRMMIPEQAAQASAEGYMAGTLLHEISHGLGPGFARINGKQVEINEAIGAVYSELEEAKADAAGMFGLKWLVDHKVLPAARMQEYYASYLAGILRTLRFGEGEAHGRAETMEFNYLLENRAIKPADGGRYAVDYARIPAVVAQLTKELLSIEAAGDRKRAEAWFAKYDKIPAALTAALAKTSDIPVDIEPVFSFRDEIR